MTLELGKTYENKQTKRRVIILGRLNTIGRKDCLLAEDVALGMILPIINENADNWYEIVDAPSLEDLTKGVNSKYDKSERS